MKSLTLQDRSKKVIVTGVKRSGSKQLAILFSAMLPKLYDPHVSLVEYEKCLDISTFRTLPKFVVIRNPIALLKVSRGNMDIVLEQHELLLNRKKYEAINTIFIPHEYLKTAVQLYKNKFNLTGNRKKITDAKLTDAERKLFSDINKPELLTVYIEAVKDYESKNQAIIQQYQPYKNREV